MITRSIVFALALLPGVALAGSVPASVDAAIRTGIAKANDRATIQQIEPSPVQGLYTVISDGEVLYSSADGKYLFFRGRLFATDGMIDQTDAALLPARREAMQSAQDHAIVFKAPEEKYVITVFTDPTCGFCRMLHGHIEDYLKAGITVRYLAYPRTGPGTPSFTLMEAVWCADDKRAALGLAKNTAAEDDPTKPDGCVTKVMDDFQLGRRIGVNATPAIFTEEGRQIGGYLDPQKMLEALNAPAR